LRDLVERVEAPPQRFAAVRVEFIHSSPAWLRICSSVRLPLGLRHDASVDLGGEVVDSPRQVSVGLEFLVFG
jgi:hypothetical protein